MKAKPPERYGACKPSRAQRRTVEEKKSITGSQKPVTLSQKPVAAASHKPLKGRKVFLDIHGHRGTATFERDIKLLGATVEKCFSKEVHILITKVGCPKDYEKSKNRDDGSGAAVSSPAPSPFSMASYRAVDSPQRPDSPSEQPSKPVMTRGQAIALKAQTATRKYGSGNTVDNARRWNIRITHIDHALKYVNKEIGKINIKDLIPEKSGTTANQPLTDKSKHKCKRLRGRFIKFESACRHYRPIVHHYPELPVIHGDSALGGCPFERPKTGKQKGTTQCGEDIDRAEREERDIKGRGIEEEDDEGLRQLEVVTGNTGELGSPQDPTTGGSRGPSAPPTGGPPKESKTRAAAKTRDSAQKAKTANKAEKQAADSVKDKQRHSSCYEAPKLYTKGELRRIMLDKLRAEQKRGYCETCEVKYDDIDKHVRSDQHRKFSRDNNNYRALDALINTGPNMTQFLNDVVKFQEYHLVEAAQDGSIESLMTPKLKKRPSERRKNTNRASDQNAKKTSNVQHESSKKQDPNLSARSDRKQPMVTPKSKPKKIDFSTPKSSRKSSPKLSAKTKTKASPKQSAVLISPKPSKSNSKVDDSPKPLPKNDLDATPVTDNKLGALPNNSKSMQILDDASLKPLKKLPSTPKKSSPMKEESPKPSPVFKSKIKQKRSLVAASELKGLLESQWTTILEKNRRGSLCSPLAPKVVENTRKRTIANSPQKVVNSPKKHKSPLKGDVVGSPKKLKFTSSTGKHELPPPVDTVKSPVKTKTVASPRKDKKLDSSCKVNLSEIPLNNKTEPCGSPAKSKPAKKLKSGKAENKTKSKSVESVDAQSSKSKGENNDVVTNCIKETRSCRQKPNLVIETKSKTVDLVEPDVAEHVGSSPGEESSPRIPVASHASVEENAKIQESSQDGIPQAFSSQEETEEEVEMDGVSLLPVDEDDHSPVLPSGKEVFALSPWHPKSSKTEPSAAQNSSRRTRKSVQHQTPTKPRVRCITPKKTTTKSTPTKALTPNKQSDSGTPRKATGASSMMPDLEHSPVRRVKFDDTPTEDVIRRRVKPGSRASRSRSPSSLSAGSSSQSAASQTKPSVQSADVAIIEVAASRNGVPCTLRLPDRSAQPCKGQPTKRGKGRPPKKRKLQRTASEKEVAGTPTKKDHRTGTSQGTPSKKVKTTAQGTPTKTGTPTKKATPTKRESKRQLERVRLKSPWRIASNRSLSQLFDSEDDKEHEEFKGFDLTGSDNGTDVSFEEVTEVDLEHNWVIEDGEHEVIAPKQLAEEAMVEIVPPSENSAGEEGTTDSPIVLPRVETWNPPDQSEAAQLVGLVAENTFGKSEGSEGWDTTVDSYIVKCISKRQTSSRLSPRKQTGRSPLSVLDQWQNGGETFWITSPKKKRGKSPLKNLVVEGAPRMSSTPNRRPMKLLKINSKASPNALVEVPLGEQKVDEDIVFNFCSPQKTESRQIPLDAASCSSVRKALQMTPDVRRSPRKRDNHRSNASACLKMPNMTSPGATSQDMDYRKLCKKYRNAITPTKHRAPSTSQLLSSPEMDTSNHVVPRLTPNSKLELLMEKQSAKKPKRKKNPVKRLQAGRTRLKRKAAEETGKSQRASARIQEQPSQSYTEDQSDYDPYQYE